MKLLVLGEEELRAALPMPAAVAAMRDAFAAISTGEGVSPLRGVIESAGGISLVMGARAPRALASKVVSVFPGNRERDLPTVPGLAQAPRTL